MTFIKYIFIVACGLLTVSIVQDKSALVGRWRWTAYEIGGKVYKLGWQEFIHFNEDGSYLNNCNNDRKEMRVCESGRWSFRAPNVIHIVRDTLPDKTILFPIDHKIFKMTTDSLIIKGKEGTRDITSFYIRQK
jgi:hypothetical protein